MTVIDIYKNLFGRKGIADGNVIDMAEHGRAGGVSTGDPFKTVRDVEERAIVDKASATTTYVGVARMGAATSSAVWQISKISTSGNVVEILYADGDPSYNNVWDNRASLSYS